MDCGGIPKPGKEFVLDCVMIVTMCLFLIAVMVIMEKEVEEVPRQEGNEAEETH